MSIQKPLSFNEIQTINEINKTLAKKKKTELTNSKQDNVEKKELSTIKTEKQEIKKRIENNDTGKLSIVRDMDSNNIDSLKEGLELTTKNVEILDKQLKDLVDNPESDRLEVLYVKGLLSKETERITFIRNKIVKLQKEQEEAEEMKKHKKILSEKAYMKRIETLYDKNKKIEENLIKKKYEFNGITPPSSPDTKKLGPLQTSATSPGSSLRKCLGQKKLSADQKEKILEEEFTKATRKHYEKKEMFKMNESSRQILEEKKARDLERSQKAALLGITLPSQGTQNSYISDAVLTEHQNYDMELAKLYNAETLGKRGPASSFYYASQIPSSLITNEQQIISNKSQLNSKSNESQSIIQTTAYLGKEENYDYLNSISLDDEKKESNNSFKNTANSINYVYSEVVKDNNPDIMANTTRSEQKVDLAQLYSLAASFLTLNDLEKQQNNTRQILNEKNDEQKRQLSSSTYGQTNMGMLASTYKIPTDISNSNYENSLYLSSIDYNNKSINSSLNQASHSSIINLEHDFQQKLKKGIIEDYAKQDQEILKELRKAQIEKAKKAREACERLYNEGQSRQLRKQIIQQVIENSTNNGKNILANSSNSPINISSSSQNSNTKDILNSQLITEADKQLIAYQQQRFQVVNTIKPKSELDQKFQQLYEEAQKRRVENDLEYLNSMKSTYKDDIEGVERKLFTPVTLKSSKKVHSNLSDYIKGIAPASPKKVNTEPEEEKQQQNVKKADAATIQNIIDNLYLKSFKKAKELNQKIEEEKIKSEKEVCTFAPTLSHGTKEICKNNNSSDPCYIKLYNMAKQINQKKEQNSMSEAAKKTQKEIKECTFQPEVYTKPGARYNKKNSEGATLSIRSLSARKNNNNGFDKVLVPMPPVSYSSQITRQIKNIRSYSAHHDQMTNSKTNTNNNNGSPSNLNTVDLSLVQQKLRQNIEDPFENKEKDIEEVPPQMPSAFDINNDIGYKNIKSFENNKEDMIEDTGSIINLKDSSNNNGLDTVDNLFDEINDKNDENSIKFF